MASIQDFFKKTFQTLGIDIILISVVLFIGLLLAIVYNGANDVQTANFSIIYLALGGAALVAAFAAKLTGWDIFRGAGYAIDQRLSVDKIPLLGLLYVILGTVAGFVFAGGGYLITNIFKSPQASGTTGFIFQNGFSPIIEAYFFRATLLPIFEAMAFPLFYNAMPKSTRNPAVAAVGAFVIAALAMSFAFMFVHLIASGGNAALLLNHFTFAMVMAVITRFLGILPEIGYHFGNNLAFPVAAQTIA